MVVVTVCATKGRRSEERGRSRGRSRRRRLLEKSAPVRAAAAASGVPWEDGRQDGNEVEGAAARRASSRWSESRQTNDAIIERRLERVERREERREKDAGRSTMDRTEIGPAGKTRLRGKWMGGRTELSRRGNGVVCLFFLISFLGVSLSLAEKSGVTPSRSSRRAVWPEACPSKAETSQAAVLRLANPTVLVPAFPATQHT